MKVGGEFYVFSSSSKGKSEVASRVEIAGSKEIGGLMVCVALGAVLEQLGLVAELEDKVVSCRGVCGPGKITFTPDFKKETIGIPEIVRRLNDEEWLKANPNHPISISARTVDVVFSILKVIKSTPPSLEIPVGSGRVILSVSGDREKQRRLLLSGGLSEKVIDSVLSLLDEYEKSTKD